MEFIGPASSGKPSIGSTQADDDTQKLPCVPRVNTSDRARVLEKDHAAKIDSASAKVERERHEEKYEKVSLQAEGTLDKIDAFRLPDIPQSEAGFRANEAAFIHMPTTPLKPLPESSPGGKFSPISRGKACLLVVLLAIVVVNATITGFGQFFGPQGWGSVFNGTGGSGAGNLLSRVNQQLRNAHGVTPGTTPQATPRLTPQQYIDRVIQSMTLDQKLGQMMLVQFVGADYSLDLSAMISQYNVGAVIVFTANGNIVSKSQLKGLISQMQQNSGIPLAVAIDQEGGTVDRLQALDGPRPSAASIGATNDPQRATAAGIQDARDLASYGFNLNLAPVVDVTNVYNPQLYGRTYGDNPTIVTQMAQAYLKGLQQSGKVLGTLKHFPGLGDVGVDPHTGLPALTRSQQSLEAIDWAPYRNLIKQGNVHAIMVTHEMVRAIDNTLPSSLSPKLINGILRGDLGFQGVVMTDSLTMESITAYYTAGQAAALAVEAGADLLMGAASPHDVAAMIDGIKQAINSGALSQQRIDDSVRRILLLKYQMGLISIPQ